MRCLRHYIKSPTTKDKNFQPHYRSLLLKTRIAWPLMLTATTSFPSVFFNSSKLWLFWWQNWLDFSASPSRFVDFAVQFCFRCNGLISPVSWHLNRDSSVRVLRKSHQYKTLIYSWIIILTVLVFFYDAEAWRIHVKSCKDIRKQHLEV